MNFISYHEVNFLTFKRLSRVTNSKISLISNNLSRVWKECSMFMREIAQLLTVAFIYKFDKPGIQAYHIYNLKVIEPELMYALNKLKSVALLI